MPNSLLDKWTRRGMHAWAPVSTAVGALGVLVVASFVATRLRSPGFHVKGKHVFITGGSEGLGLATAKRYAAAGAKVSIVARQLAKLEEAKAEVETVYRDASDSPRVFAQSCDMTDFDAVQRAVDAANAFHDRVTDHIVCCAGYIQPGYFLEQDVQHMERSMDVNYFGTLYTIRAALPAMTRSTNSNDKQLVFVGSGLSLLGCIGTSQYSASKFALRGLAEALRNELKASDVRISIFYAGNIDTEGFRREQDLMPDEGKTIAGVSPPLTADKAAQQMIDGITRGDFSITNDPLVFLLRVIANGVAPRFNSALELLVLPLAVPIGVVFCGFMDTVVWWSRRSRKRAGREE